jgi:hypothetical protein
MKDRRFHKCAYCLFLGLLWYAKWIPRLPLGLYSEWELQLAADEWKRWNKASKAVGVWARATPLRASWAFLTSQIPSAAQRRPIEPDNNPAIANNAAAE